MGERLRLLHVHAHPDDESSKGAASTAKYVADGVDVHRDPGVAVVCVLEAQAADHFVVGERQVRVPAGPQQTLTRTYRIETERPATNAVLDSCRPAPGGQG